MSADPDFIIFQQLQTSMSTCLLYDMYTELSPKVVRRLAKAWTAIPGDTNQYCNLCSESTPDGIKHALCECPGSLLPRSLLLQDIRLNINTELADELGSDAPDIFMLKVLGSEPDTNIDAENKALLCKRCLTYAYSCLKNLI